MHYFEFGKRDASIYSGGASASINTGLDEILEINKNVHKLIELEGNGKIIGFFTKIGNYSGMVEINIDGNIFEENLWDRWCHYERLHYNLNFEYNNYFNIKILDKKFDTSLCKDNMDFTKIKKKIDLKKIYYIGELKLINIL